MNPDFSQVRSSQGAYYDSDDERQVDSELNEALSKMLSGKRPAENKTDSSKHTTSTQPESDDESSQRSKKQKSEPDSPSSIDTAIEEAIREGNNKKQENLELQKALIESFASEKTVNNKRKMDDLGDNLDRLAVNANTSEDEKSVSSENAVDAGQQPRKRQRIFEQPQIQEPLEITVPLYNPEQQDALQNTRQNAIQQTLQRPRSASFQEEHEKEKQNSGTKERSRSF